MPVLTREDFPDGCFEPVRLRARLDLHGSDLRLQVHDRGID